MNNVWVACVLYTCYYRCKVTCILYLGESLIKLINSCSTTPNDAPLFEIQTTPRNELFWSTTSVESIMRPVCFIPTINTFSYYKSWCNVAQPNNFHHSFLHFTCFNFQQQFCDRSNWNCGSYEEDRAQRLSFELHDSIRDIATSGLNVEDIEDEAEDLSISEIELDDEEEDF